MTRPFFPLARAFAFAAVVFPVFVSARPPDVVLSGHGGPVIDVAFSRDGARLATAGDDGKLKVWDIAARKELFTYDGIRSAGNNIRFSPDGKSLVVIGGETNVVVIDAATGKPIRSIPLPDMIGGAAALDVSPDGATAAVVGRGKLRLLNLATGATRAEYPVHPGYGVTAVAFSADGRLIATAGTDNTATVVETASGKILHTVKIGLNGVDIALSLDGKTLYVSTTARVVEAVDLSTGSAKNLVEKQMMIFKVAVSRDGKTLVLAGIGHGPSLVSLPDGALADPAFESEEWVKCTAISADSHWLAGGGHGGSIFIWKNGN